jgi:hypothetical protein
LVKTLERVLRPNVAYVTVSQNDDGLPGRDAKFARLLKVHNVVVLSAGGYGHVPILLLKQTEERNNYKDPVERNYLWSFVGSPKTSPRNM